MPNSTYVIAVSGPSGAGKTTLIRNLTSQFGDAVALGIDDYPDDHYPPAAEWMERGANPDEFETPQFYADVRTLKEGRSITHPDSKEETNPPAYLIIEEPFGKSRSALRPLIDFHVEVDIPLEVSLARRLLRIMGNPTRAEKPVETYAFVKQHLEWYLNNGRHFYLAVQANAQKDKDLTVDGTLPPEQISQKVMDAIHAKRANG